MLFHWFKVKFSLELFDVQNLPKGVTPQKDLQLFYHIAFWLSAQIQGVSQLISYMQFKALAIAFILV